ncbi:malto-oligosyltrehalose trehalohydrolase [Undibacterium sp.]|uniref:malto-oligosyltrehalose trehalohydrolase n=1 Tax=Undibacterium sp. TaxID=1914977 RepID=UPI00374D27FF
MSSFEPSAAAHSGSGFGAQLVAPGRTVFRIWAPDKQNAFVVIDGGEPQAMQPQAAGWFQLEADCGAGARYAYGFAGLDKADGTPLLVPDPASRLQEDDVHGRSVVTDPHAYQWRCADWRGRPWEETVLYELHAGAMGGYAGIMQRLPELASLGITAVELMPVADFPGKRNWGYDGVLPYAPDTAYGTPDQLKQMIDTAHGLGIMVFLDVVYNHFGPDGNYLGAYASPFFRQDLHTPWGAAIDFRVPEVGRFFTDNALYWLNEFRFDGLRFDAMHAISEQQWLPELARQIRQAMAPGRHVHLVLEHEDNAAHLLQQGFDAQWNDDGHHVLHVMLTGEQQGYYRDYSERAAEKLARCLSQGFIYQGQPSVVTGKPRGESSAGLPPTAFVLFLQNHDQIGNRAFGERLITMSDPRALHAASALLLLSPQIPMLFMGEENGAQSPFVYFTDHGNAELVDAVRNGRRSEFAHFAAFSDPQRLDAIPDTNDATSFDRSIPQQDGEAAQAWRNWTRALLDIRRAHVVPRLAGAIALGAQVLGSAAVAASWRLGDGAVLSIALNLGPHSVAISASALDVDASARVLFEYDGSAMAPLSRELPAYGFVAVLAGAPGAAGGELYAG